jgi:hypothetical protein
MKLSHYFTSIAYKRLSVVEADSTRSHQHEFHGTEELKKMFGKTKCEFVAKFSYLAENQPEPLSADVGVTWYDARESHKTRSEYRLYYHRNPINDYMQEGDLMVIAMHPSGGLYFFIAQKNSTYENQLVLLFELPENVGTKLQARDLTKKSETVDFVRSFILGEIGIEIEQTDENYLDLMIEKFSDTFPSTAEFSEFARSTLPAQDIKNDPDGALMNWMEREELLFRTFERHLVMSHVKKGFENIENFISLSLSVQNRRKARVGYALENHLEKIFQQLEVSFSRGKETENNSKPDFVFPSIEKYRDASFPADKLFMLGAKSTCKDRWRQVLAEAARIKNKHLITLEPGISTNQTDEMVANSLQLVIPKPLLKTYTNSQQKQLINFKDFIDVVG